MSMRYFDPDDDLASFKRSADYLKLHGPEIGARAQAGDQCCRNIVNLYGLCYRHADHASIGLLEAALDDYKRRQANKGAQDGREL